VFCENGIVMVKDANSANGVLLEGKQVLEARWSPGQALQIGTYRLALAETNAPSARPFAEPRGSAAPAPAFAAAAQSVMAQPSRLAPEIRQRTPAGSGRIEMGDAYRRAKTDDPQAVRQLFLGFLGRHETVIDCGYLGALGIIFPEHSFWCLTNARICGMIVNASGRVDFTFCFLKAVDVAHFHQPSQVGLWVTIIFYLLSVAFIAFGFMASGFMLGPSPAGFVSFLFGLLIAAIGIYLIPLVTRFYYRFTKSGCAFFTKEHVYMSILADRNNLKPAQSMLRLFEEQKRALGV
jgi:hypothetical protein